MFLVLNAVFILGLCCGEHISSQTTRPEAIMEPQQCQCGFGVLVLPAFTFSFYF